MSLKINSDTTVHSSQLPNTMATPIEHHVNGIKLLDHTNDKIVKIINFVNFDNEDFFVLSKNTQCYNFKNEVVWHRDEFPVLFENIGYLPFSKGGQTDYVEVRDLPANGVEIIAHKLPGSAEKIKSWHVKFERVGCYNTGYSYLAHEVVKKEQNTLSLLKSKFIKVSTMALIIAATAFAGIPKLHNSFS